MYILATFQLSTSLQINWKYDAEKLWAECRLSWLCKGLTYGPTLFFFVFFYLFVWYLWQLSILASQNCFLNINLSEQNVTESKGALAHFWFSWKQYIFFPWWLESKWERLEMEKKDKVLELLLIIISSCILKFCSVQSGLLGTVTWLRYFINSLYNNYLWFLKI